MFSIGIGIGTQNKSNAWLEVFYPRPLLHPSPELIQGLGQLIDLAGNAGTLALDEATRSALCAVMEQPDQLALLETLKDSQKPCVLTWLKIDGPIESTPAAYLKLHLLSHGLTRPNSLNLEGIYAALPNIAWTSDGPMDLSELPDAMLLARLAGRHLEVTSLDKFPKLTNYVTPEGVRIADSARVRLGAYLGAGTTVMHEGFVNFNAGTEGPNMVEGRISQGVFVAKGSDLGGSASTAGTLSGGGNHVISIGEDCLISANAGTGISLGDRCTIEAGLYITPGTQVSLLDEQGDLVKTLKARELNAQNDLLFIRHSQTGVVQCRTNRQAIALNAQLHQHN